LKPGSSLTVLKRDDSAAMVELRLASGESLWLGERAASKILVEASTAAG
jgi:hypothetical protein